MKQHLTPNRRIIYTRHTHTKKIAEKNVENNKDEVNSLDIPG